jgi:hypothetical protein
LADFTCLRHIQPPSVRPLRSVGAPAPLTSNSESAVRAGSQCRQQLPQNDSPSQLLFDGALDVTLRITEAGATVASRPKQECGRFDYCQPDQAKTMNVQLSGKSRSTFVALTLLALASLPFGAVAQQQFSVKPIAEKRLMELPRGPLFWRVENFATLAQAQASEGPTSLAAEVAGKVWLFTLGPKGATTTGGSNVAEIGPIPAITAPEYLLRVNFADAPPGTKTQVHSHPGSETFYVLTGRLGQKTPSGPMHVDAAQPMTGHAPGTPMQVYNDGDADMTALVMFVVDATKPFSSPASFE